MRYNKLIFIISIVLLMLYFVSESMPVTAEQYNYQPVIVRHGDTLWRLAKDTGINMDTHRLVLKIMVYNSLANSTILPGQTIYIPVAI
ncbi:MAG: LysM peptidoglycan-binding domain-containing protein [Desulfitobacteriaceae bacterium]|nr:LysM peptidoglycan-binding domain-containing protein [Desulfitobacteriaceae bacterium]